MTLEDTLSQIAQETAAQKAREQEAKQDKALWPVRARVKEIESVRLQLAFIKGSLEIKSDAPDKSQRGRGMKEHATETASSIAKQSGQLDSLMGRHLDTLQTLGIESRDQLISHSTLGEEAEVLAYKQAVAQGEGLKEAESALQRRLQGLGVAVDANSFSYEAVEKALGERLQTVEGELRKEKLKTPEGRAEVTAMLAKDLERRIPKMFLSGRGYAQLEKLSFDTGYPNTEIVFLRKEQKITNWSGNRLLGLGSGTLGRDYDWNVVQEALTKAYATNLDGTFHRFSQGTGTSVGIQEQEAIKEGILKLIGTAVNAQIIEAQVSGIQTSDGKPFARDISDAKERVARLNTEVGEARKKIEDLTKRERAIAQGEQVVKTRGNMFLSVPSIEKEVEQVEANLNTERPNLVRISGQIRTHRNNEPKIFGKAEWQTQLDVLIKQETASKGKIDTWEKELPKLRDSRQIRLAKDIYYIDHYGVDRLIADQELSGTKEEVFGQLRAVLNEVANRKPPELLVRLFADYEVLAAKLA